MKKKFICIFCILLISFFCFAKGSAEMPVQSKYVASTSWVASIAELAGIDGIVTIAPADLKHPPEYEITPDDMAKVASCELFCRQDMSE